MSEMGTILNTLNEIREIRMSKKTLTSIKGNMNCLAEHTIRNDSNVKIKTKKTKKLNILQLGKTPRDP